VKVIRSAAMMTSVFLAGALRQTSISSGRSTNHQ
jgi:hypothetical protein